jgi:D-3-phosphoglycerate dehydrogenase / 2-oxoglutarate reductase
LDVFEQEPPDRHHEIFSLPNVLTTPHIASRSLKAFLDSRWRAARNMWAMISGVGQADIVNPAARPSKESA